MNESTLDISIFFEEIAVGMRLIIRLLQLRLQSYRKIYINLLNSDNVINQPFVVFPLKCLMQTSYADGTMQL